MTVTNPRRKKQIMEFIDKDHDVMSEYYELMERDMSAEKLLKEMKRLIAEDNDFYDPYLVVADILFRTGKTDQANEILKEAYERAMRRIVDAEGRWPKEMPWGWMENRHIMRAIERYAFLCWEKGDLDEALLIFGHFLRVNPNDNQGVRNYILAIRMGLDIEKWEKQFLADNPVQAGALDAIKLHDWFKNNAIKFPDDFDWLLKRWEKEGLI